MSDAGRFPQMRRKRSQRSQNWVGHTQFLLLALEVELCIVLAFLIVFKHAMPSES